SGSTNVLGKAEATENFHRPRVAAFHLRVAERRVVLLDQRAADAALAEIDGERQPDRSSPDDENLGIHSYPLYTMALRRASEPEERYGVAGADLCLVRRRYVEGGDRRHLRADVMRAALRAERR